jgi:hypothetical protein
MMNLPEARTDKLLTTELEDEVVVYDPARKQAHSLNRTAVAVWHHSDGETSLAELRRRVEAEIGVPVSEATVWLALRKLERAHLLVEKLGSAEPMTRRQVLSKGGRLGAAAMVATPIILSANVLPAAAALSVCSGTSAVCEAGCHCQPLFPTPGSPPTTQCVITPAVIGATCTGTGVGVSNCAAGIGKCYVAGSTTLCGIGQSGCICSCQSAADCGGVTTSCVNNFPNYCAQPCTGPFACTCP